MEIQKVTDTAFAKYGKVMSDIPVERILKEMEHTPLPEDVIYVPSVEALEVLPDAVQCEVECTGVSQILRD